MGTTHDGVKNRFTEETVVDSSMCGNTLPHTGDLRNGQSQISSRENDGHACVVSHPRRSDQNQWPDPSDCVTEKQNAFSAKKRRERTNRASSIMKSTMWCFGNRRRSHEITLKSQGQIMTYDRRPARGKKSTISSRTSFDCDQARRSDSLD